MITQIKIIQTSENTEELVNEKLRNLALTIPGYKFVDIKYNYINGWDYIIIIYKTTQP